MMQSPIYLVPCDFSPKFESALRLGLDLAHYNKGSVVMMHITSKKSEKAEAVHKMKKVVAALKPEESTLVEYRVIEGNIYEDIAKAAEILGVSLIVMGTHGAKGMQKLMGSHALKMVNATGAPFMITQGNKYVDKMKHIVFPFSHDKESIQIAPFVYTLAKQFKSTVHLVGFHDKDALIESKMKTHQRLLVKYFADHQTECVIAHIDKTKNFEKELISYAQQVDADLFAATFFSSSLIKGMSGFLQALIENEYSIPVLTVNAEDLVVSSVSSVMM